VPEQSTADTQTATVAPARSIDAAPWSLPVADGEGRGELVVIPPASIPDPPAVVVIAPDTNGGSNSGGGSGGYDIAARDDNGRHNGWSKNKDKDD
jgi:hypothetical protein